MDPTDPADFSDYLLGSYLQSQQPLQPPTPQDYAAALAASPPTQGLGSFPSGRMSMQISAVI